jgi:hypothetical protein
MYINDVIVSLIMKKKSKNTFENQTKLEYHSIINRNMIFFIYEIFKEHLQSKNH